MDSSSPSTSTSDSSDHSEVRNGEDLALDEIMKMKEKRLKLLDQYRNEQEVNLLPLIREAQNRERKRKRKPAVRPKRKPNAVKRTPSRRSERIRSQATVNVNRPRERVRIPYDPMLEEDFFVKPANGYGPTPGIEIGHQWSTRLECSHDGVHRPTIAGIHPGPMGAYSIALSGGYPEDIDEGDTVIFTGAGGRDLKGTMGRSRSVRSAPQIRDQELNGANMSLIRSLETGLPVRLIRGHKLGGSFAPQAGYRYDGLYRVIQYCYTFGYSGYRVFRFRMARLDEQNPAPWETTPRILPPIPSMSLRVLNRFPEFLDGGDLDRQIQDCIMRLCQDSSFGYYDDDDDQCPFSTFRGWNMP